VSDDAPVAPFGGDPTALDSLEDLHFAQITDVHLSTERRCLPADFRGDLARILERHDLDFIIASGDLTAGGKPEEFAAFRDIVDSLSVPVYPAAGNHDDDSSVDAGAYRQALGPLHYSTRVGPLHLVVYDGEAWQREGLSAGENGEAFPWIASTIDDWLDADLTALSPDQPILLVNHFPWGEQLYRRMHSHRIVGVLSGHWHSSRRCVDSGGLVHYATPSLCFGGIDQSPRGYRTFRYADRELESRSHTLSPRPLWPGVGDRATPALTTTLSKPHLGQSWPQFQGGARRTGFAHQGPTPPLGQVWCASLPGAIHTAPPVLAEDQVVQTTWDDDDGMGAGISALDAATGKRRWRFASGASIRHSAAFAQGRVHAITTSGRLVCLDAGEGALRWSYDLPDPSNRWVYSSPLVVDGNLIAGISSHLVCLKAETGQVSWTRMDLGIEDWISSYPSPASDGQCVVVAFYMQPTSLAALDVHSGETIWQRDGDKANYIYATPVIDDDSVIAVSGSAVRAVDLKTGDVRWECPISLQRVQSTPSLSGKHLVVSTGQGQVHTIDTTCGELIWTWQIETQIPMFTPYLRQGPTTLSSPIVAGDLVWVGGADGCLYAISMESGSLVWSVDIGSPVGASPIASGDAMWIGTTDGRVRCLTTDA